MRLFFCAALLLFSLSAFAAGLPSFDIKALCSAAAGDGESSSGKVEIDECIDNENVARDALKIRVATLSEEKVQKCINSVSEGHTASYLALLGCIGQSDSGETKLTPSTISRLPSTTVIPVPPLSEGVSVADPSSKSASMPNGVYFDHDVGLHSDDPDVKRLQIFLNTHGFPVSSDGPGSPGNEAEHFGPSTKVALEKFQKAHSMEITMPAATGRFDAVTRRYINALQP